MSEREECGACFRTEAEGHALDCPDRQGRLMSDQPAPSVEREWPCEHDAKGPMYPTCSKCRAVLYAVPQPPAAPDYDGEGLSQQYNLRGRSAPSLRETLDVDRLAEKMTRLADSPRSRWHDDVLPNGAGDSWVCVPIGDVLNALPAADPSLREALDVERLAEALREHFHLTLLTECPNADFDYDECAARILAGLASPRSDGDAE